MVVTKHKTHLKAGNKAPDFKSKDQDGNEISLKDFAGKKLVLYFYPKDDTPGCTKEACSFRDDISAFEKLKSSLVELDNNFIKRYRF